MLWTSRKLKRAQKRKMRWLLFLLAYILDLTDVEPFAGSRSPLFCWKLHKTTTKKKRRKKKNIWFSFTWGNFPGFWDGAKISSCVHLAKRRKNLFQVNLVFMNQEETATVRVCILLLAFHWQTLKKSNRTILVLYCYLYVCVHTFYWPICMYK